MSKIKISKNVKTILAIDPGLTSMGWAYAGVNLKTGKFTVYDYGIIKPDKIARKEKDVYGLFENRILRVHTVEKEYIKLVDKYKADFHVSESAFFHFRSPDAYAALSICIYTLVAVLYRKYREGSLPLAAATLRKFAPRQIKKVVSLDGTSGKEKMQSSVLNNEDIKFHTKPEKPLIEHEADAIGCAYTFVKVSLPEILNDLI